MANNPTEALRAAMALIATVRRLWELSSSTRVDEAIRKEWQTATNALSGEFDAASILIVPLLPAAHRLSEKTGNTIELGDMSATSAFCLTFELGFHFVQWVKGVQDWSVLNVEQIAEPVSLAKDRFPPMPKPVEWNRLLSRLDLEASRLMAEADGKQMAEPANANRQQQEPPDAPEVAMLPDGPREGIQFDAETRALAVMAQKPDLTSITEIAREAGCSREHLSKNCPRFRAAWDVACKMRKQPSRIVRGSKDKNGNIEAWQNDGENDCEVTS